VTIPKLSVTANFMKRHGKAFGLCTVSTFSVLFLAAVYSVHGSLVGFSRSARWHSRAGRASGIDGYDDRDGSLVDLCQCACCYEVAPGKKHCIESPRMEYEVRACSECDVQGCSTRFNHVCSDVSVVNASCIKRKGWLFQLIPFLFLCATAALVVYGVATPRKVFRSSGSGSEASVMSVSQVNGDVTSITTIRTFGTFESTALADGVPSAN
jgi:hypothetical protein